MVKDEVKIRKEIIEIKKGKDYVFASIITGQ